MALVVKDQFEARELTPAGNYFFVVTGIYDIGTQPGGQYGPKRQIIATFELHKKSGPVKDAKGNVARAVNFYSLSFGEKSNLRQDVDSILGRSFTPEEAKQGFDVLQLVGMQGRLRLVHAKKDNGEFREKIDSIMTLDEDDPAIKAYDDLVPFELTPEILASKELPDVVPEWIQKKIRESHEFTGKATGKANGKPSTNGHAVNPDDEDCPF